MRYRPETYARALTEVLNEKRVSEGEAIKNFLALVRKNGDWGEIGKIKEAVEAALTKNNGGSNMSLEFGVLPSESTLNKFKALFTSKDRVKTFFNKKLIAGVRILIDGEKELDYSFKSKLRKIFK